MITNLNNFVAAFKDVTSNHIDLYSNEATELRKWGEQDFDVTELLKDMDSINSVLLYGAVKKAYDTIRAYHRAYRIYLQSSGDYFRAAIIEKEKDKLIMDNAVNNLSKVYTTLKEELGAS